MSHYRKQLIKVVVLAAFALSCNKQNEFLNAKPSASLSTINSISDINNLLNKEGLFNNGSSPSIGQGRCDDFYITDQDFSSFLNSIEQKVYTYSQSIYSATDIPNDWAYVYAGVYQANTVLDALPHISAPKEELDDAKGRALFFRSIAFYNLVQTFAMPYDPLTSDKDSGIILKLTSDLNVRPIRSSEQQCYNQILQDLKVAAELLNEKSQPNTRPNKVAAYALLGRVYLAIGDYDSAFTYSNKALSFNSSLFDYNRVIPGDFTFADGSQYPLNEDIYHTTMIGSNLSSPIPTVVDSTIISSYDSNDLRKDLFFFSYADALRFKGSYEFNSYGLLYDGLATDELYLIRSESYIRMGDFSKGIQDLNTLLKNRYKTGTFKEVVVGNQTEALDSVLLERRKELLFRGLRWTDLRRLNKEPRYQRTLMREIGGNKFLLPPNDERYALPIPYTETTLDK